MKNRNFYPSLVLGCICLVVAILLSVINIFTAPIIAARQNAAANEALLEVLPNGSNFKEIEITADYPSIVKKGWTADGGCVFQMEVIGYASGLVIMCGVDSDGKIAGVKHIATNETFGAEGELNGKYTDKADNLDSLEMILSSSASKGAPMTAKAYYDALKAALQSALIAGGAEVDTRTPEQIFQDDCNIALGTEGMTFTKWFATEVIVGIDAVYECQEGRVYVIGENLIGVKNGEVVTADVSSENSAAALEADETIATAGELTEVAKPDGTSANVTKISVTESGNYVIEVLGHGYKYESNLEFVGVAEGEIEIKVSIDADGKIIDVITVAHHESKGYGDACATEDYYDQYRGHVNSDIVITVPSPDFHDDQIADGCPDIGAISNSTFTSTAYQSAIKAAFAAFEKLTTEEGGND